MSSQSLSTRRGSTSAPDPFGAHAHLNRPSTSTLTIVRVPGSTAINLQEPPSTHKKFDKFSRWSGAGTSPNRPSSGSGQSENRLSFAFSSFGQTPSRSDGHSPTSSPNTSPRIRPSSPRYSAGLVSKPRLSAEQLVDLARHSVIARPTPGSTPHSPVLSLRSQSPNQLSAPPIAHPTPPTFTPLPDDIYLPFIHRAEEVSQLISNPPTTKLFALLSQAFSKRLEQDDPTLVENTIPPGDPVQWTYPQLIHHLTKVDRDVCSDADWVFGARKCIMSHSELIWERVKAALGVPPELDIDEPEEEQSLTFSLDDSAIIDSPITDRSSFGSEHAPFGADVLQRLREELEPSSGADTPVPAGQSVDLASAHSPHGDVPIQPDATSPPLSEHEDLEASHLTIEPLLSTSSHSSHPPPLSLSSSLSNAASDGGLGDIAEDAEDEAEDDETDETKPQDDHPELIDPMQIQGLRISTGTLTPSDSVINSPVGSTSIPLYNHGTNDQPPSMSPAEKLLSSRTPIGITRGRAGLTGRSYRRTRPASMSSYDPRDWDMPYDAVGERGPGNPLFPSSFARLALGPTLRANNPSLRTPIAPPPSRYTPGLTFHKGAFTTTGVLGHKARSQSWAMPLRDAESEYALVGGIESSVGE